jgi:hypothetical protein
MNGNLVTTAIALLCACLLQACAHRIQFYEYKNDASLDHVYVKKEVDFSHYRSMLFDEVSVWHPRENGPSPEKIASVRANLARMQELFDATFTAALGDRYTRSASPGRNTLRLEVQFIDLRALPPGSPIPQDLTRYVFRTQPGHITMVARLFDARSGELLARAADLGKRASAGGEAVVDWEAIASDLDYWARVFRAWLDPAQDAKAAN